MRIDYEAERMLTHEDFNREMKLDTTVSWRTGFVYGRFEGYHFSDEMTLDV